MTQTPPMSALAPHQLRQLIELTQEIDARIESAQRDNLSVEETLAQVLPILCARTGARGALVRSYDETQRLRVFRWPEDLRVKAETQLLLATEPAPGAVGSDRGPEAFAREWEGDFLVAQPLDVAGDWFGSAALVLTPADVKDAAGSDRVAFLRQALDAACEEMDTFLSSVRGAREKQRVMMGIADALKRRVLADALKQAVEIIAPAISADRLLLVCRASEEPGGEIHVLLFEQGRITLDTIGEAARESKSAAAATTRPVDLETIRAEAGQYLAGTPSPLLGRLRFETAQDETIIAGATQSSIVGAIRFQTARQSFSTRDRDLIAGFSSFIRQRIVDFNKEWRGLAAHFRADDIHRLLRSEDYSRRYLTPRVAEVAILFADISGFTRVSEGILKDPESIARLIETWGKEAVSLIWSHGGVFDKMVGDCVIAFWGPPFFAGSPDHYVREAIACAKAIRAMTTGIPERPGLEALRSEGLGVSTGVSFAPVCLGRFAPNDGFTGFSSGMNNTARLQGLATRDEILVMEQAIARLGSPEPSLRFGDTREGRAKNVAEPLRFRPLL